MQQCTVFTFQSSPSVFSSYKMISFNALHSSPIALAVHTYLSWSGHMIFPLFGFTLATWLMKWGVSFYVQFSSVTCTLVVLTGGALIFDDQDGEEIHLQAEHILITDDGLLQVHLSILLVKFLDPKRTRYFYFWCLPLCNWNSSMKINSIHLATLCSYSLSPNTRAICKPCNLFAIIPVTFLFEFSNVSEHLATLMARSHRALALALALTLSDGFSMYLWVYSHRASA